MTTAVQTVPTSEVLTLAADMIRDGRWAQGEGWNVTERGICVEGALLAALEIPVPDHDSIDPVRAELVKCPAYQAVEEYLQEKGEMHTPKSLWAWNDRGDNTRAKVIRTLRAVARREKKKEQQSE